MKQTLLALPLLLITSAAAPAALMLTGIYDGGGSTPKGLEIYVTSSGSYDGWTVDQQFNANTGTWAVGYIFDATAYAEGDFIYLTSTEADPVITGAGGITIADTSFNANGDDRVRITDGTVTIDQHGVTDTDGTGAAWEFTDSYAYRNSGTTADGSFDITDWSYGGPDLLDTGNEPLAAILGSYTIPEPTTSLLGALGLLALLRRRR